MVAGQAGPGSMPAQDFVPSPPPRSIHDSSNMRIKTMYHCVHNWIHDKYGNSKSIVQRTNVNKKSTCKIAP